jgi:hypothetical protein
MALLSLSKALDGCESSTSRSGRFSPGRAGVDVVVGEDVSDRDLKSGL